MTYSYNKRGGEMVSYDRWTNKGIDYIRHFKGKKINILAPIVKSRKGGMYRKLFDNC